jgi:hypothetical protein
VSALALVAGILSATAIALPVPGPYLAVALGLFAVVSGLLAFRRSRGRRPAVRLAAAAAVALGLAGGVLGGLRVGLVLAALARLEALL